MKWLRKFEDASDSLENVYIIKDVFQDIIDDFDLEVLMGRDHSRGPGNYIRFNGDLDNSYGWDVLVNIFNVNVLLFASSLPSEEFKEAVEAHTDRLKRMGFVVKLNNVEYYSILIKL